MDDFKWKFYGYDDADLSLRYGDIDVFSPICDINLVHVVKNRNNHLTHFELSTKYINFVL